MSRHQCKYWKTYAANKPRAFRICGFCHRKQFRDSELGWRDEIKLEQFADNWLPTRQHSSDYRSLMTIEVAFPFEFRSYETWNMAIKVRFHFPDFDEHLTTRIDAIHGWESPWCEDLNEVDMLLRRHYTQVTGRTYDIGDNAYEAMRKLIQS